MNDYVINCLEYFFRLIFLHAQLNIVMTFVYTYIWMAIYFSIPFCTFFRLLAIICKNELICDTCNLYIQPNALMLFVFVYYNFVISIYVSV